MSDIRWFQPVRSRIGIVSALLVVAGLSAGAAAVGVQAQTMGFLSAAEQTTGTVVGLEERVSTRDTNGTTRRITTYAPVVEFTVAGQQYEFAGSIASDPPGYDVGDQVTVRYDPTDPTDARIESFANLYLLPLVFGLVGLALTAAGTTLGTVAVRRLRRRAWLRRHGHPVAGQITSIETTRYRIDRRHPYVIHVSWQDAYGRRHTARSEAVWPDPRPAVDVGYPMRVLVDPGDPARHLVELPPPPDPEPSATPPPASPGW